MTLEVVHRAVEGLEEEFIDTKMDNVRGELCDMAIFVPS